MAKLYNLARMTTATTGTGTITLGSAVTGWLSFAGAGVSNGETVTYAIVEGNNREIGRGVYTSSGTTLTRSVLKSTNSDAAISLGGAAQVFITAAKEDFMSPFCVETPTIPTTSLFTKIEGVASSSSMANVSRGVALTITGAGAVDRVAMLEATTPGSTWTLTAQILHQIPWQNWTSVGVCARDSSTAKIHAFTLGTDTASSIIIQYFRIQRFTDATTWSSNVTVQCPIYQSPIWFRLVCDSTNFTFYFSLDGENFTQVYQVSKTAWLATIDRAGIFFNVNQQTAPQNVAETIIVSSWSLT